MPPVFFFMLCKCFECLGANLISTPHPIKVAAFMQGLKNKLLVLQGDISRWVIHPSVRIDLACKADMGYRETRIVDRFFDQFFEYFHALHAYKPFPIK